MATIVPTLTVDGFVENPAQKLLKIYEYFLTSDYSQTVTYNTYITSFVYIVREFSDDMSNLKTNLINKLSTLVSRYFDLYDVDVFIDEDDSFINIGIDINVTVDDKKYSLNEVTSVSKTNLTNSYKHTDYLISGEWYE